MSHVFDSSSIINLCTDRRMDILRDGRTLSLTLFEVGNAVWKQVYQRKSLSLEEGGRALAVLTKLIESMEETRVQDGVAVLNIAVQHGITYYDASYIQAAIENGSTLVTDDGRLRSAAEKHVKTTTSIDLAR